MALSIYNQRNLDRFIDQYDDIPNNGRAGNISKIDQNFIDDFKRTFIPQNTCVDPSFIHEAGRYLSDHMKLKGAQAFFEGVFHHCPENFQSVLCHDRHPNPMAQIISTPILQSRYASKVQAALEKIKTASPATVSQLETMAKSGTIVFTEQKYFAPALIDPVGHKIILTEAVFTSYPYNPIPNGRAPINVLRDEVKKDLKNHGANFHASHTGEQLRQLASALGLDPLFIEENLAHELEHLNQIDPNSTDNDFPNKQKKWIAIKGYFYDLSVYMYLFGVTLEKKGLQLQDVLDGVDRRMAEKEGLGESVALGYRITEDRAKTVAGETIQNIKSKN